MPATVLRRLRDLPDFEMTPDSPDVRGWTVRGAEGTALGTVYELIVAPASLTVRYLDVVLDARFRPDPLEQHILLPIAAASLDAESSSVFVPALREAAVPAYPPFMDIKITPELEAAMQRALGN